MGASKQTAVGYSYVRFSSPEQGRGDSVRRQSSLRDAWLAKTGVELDTSLSLRDEGVSAFTGEHRTNPDRHALAAFLELVKHGRVRPGSYLIVESLDRLSREHIQPALILFLNLLQAGIRVVQLLPVEQVFDNKSDSMQIMMAIMELSRGNSESVMKSVRVGEKWAERKRNAAATGAIVTRRCPAWLEVRDGKFLERPKAVAAVREIFRLAIAGMGCRAISQKLNADGVKGIGPSGEWDNAYIRLMLRSRAVLGEYQPFRGRRKNRKPDGPPVPCYYPAIVSEREWHAAQAAMKARTNCGGRLSHGLVNPFSRLLFDARNGGRMYLNGRVSQGRYYHVLTPSGGNRGRNVARYASFPYVSFERAILSKLAELNPRELLPHEKGAESVLELAGRLASVEGKIAKLKARLLEDEDFESLVDVLRTLEATRSRLAERLAEERRRAASPLSESLGECLTLARVVADAADQDEVRIRLRSALRRIVSGIWCLFLPCGERRLAYVQFRFVSGNSRTYLIYHTPARQAGETKRRAFCIVGSFTGLGFDCEFDLRKPEHVRICEEQLGDMTPDELAELLKPTPGGPAVVELPAPHNPTDSASPAPASGKSRRRSGRRKG